MATPLAIAAIVEVHDLFKDKSKWTKGLYARNADDEDVDPCDPTACCWCLIGGLRKVLKVGENEPNAIYDEAKHIILIVTRAKYNYPQEMVGILGLNDVKGYEAVMEVLEEAASVG